MALLGEFGDNYTRTGNNAFTRFANWLSFSPFGDLKVIGTVPKAIAAISGFIGTAVETLGHLFRLRIGSAATALVAGTVGNSVNLAVGVADSVVPISWWINLASGVTTSTSLGTHARKLTEEAIGAVTGALGIKPQILQSHPVAIGYLNPNYFPQIPNMPPAPIPGRFASMEAQRRGQDPMAYHQTKLRGEDMREHMATLDAARGQQRQLA